MAATALLRFEQGALIGANGVALEVVAGAAVTVLNSDNTDVASWRIEVLYAPPGSVLQQSHVIVPGSPYVLAQSNSGSVPAASLTPEVGFEGECYRIRLRVWSATNYSGVMSEDIRCVAVPYGSLRLIIPPYQKLPDPLPLVGTHGLANERPSETNFGGNPWGWSGGTYSTYGYRLVNEILRRVGRVEQHHDLSGLGDDDHTQYLLANGTRTAAYIKFGANPATMGAVRLSDENGIYSRNHAGTADLQLMKLSGLGDYLSIGEAGVSTVGIIAYSQAGLYTDNGSVRLSDDLLRVVVVTSAAALTSSGEHGFYRYHNTLCVVTENSRTTIAPTALTVL